jgi:queuine tRNA-ribosyltransferase
MFQLLKKSKKSEARLGEVKTASGKFFTPVFMPIATFGSVKGLTPDDLEKIGAEIILANTYHLFQRPGDEVIKNTNGSYLKSTEKKKIPFRQLKQKGLHSFMHWYKPILTDSGGYQVFSLSRFKKISLAGVEFNSEIDGQKIFLSPEKALEIQKNLNSDICMVLDYCIGYKASKKEVEKSVAITSLWAERSKKYAQKINFSNLIFGIVQGGVFKDLREKSLVELLKLDFDGYAIGGLAVGEPEKKMKEIVSWLAPKLPEEKPRYLMGVGYPEQILEMIKYGVDMFDCVIPTRHARHGELFIRNDKKIIKNGKVDYQIIEIGKSKYKAANVLLDKYCDCETCQKYSLAYLHHLYKNNELLYHRLASIHNLKFYLDLIREIRLAIKNGRL